MLLCGSFGWHRRGTRSARCSEEHRVLLGKDGRNGMIRENRKICWLCSGRRFVTWALWWYARVVDEETVNTAIACVDKICGTSIKRTIIVLFWFLNDKSVCCSKEKGWEMWCNCTAWWTRKITMIVACYPNGNVPASLHVLKLFEASSNFIYWNI